MLEGCTVQHDGQFGVSLGALLYNAARTSHMQSTSIEDRMRGLVNALAASFSCKGYRNHVVRGIFAAFYADQNPYGSVSVPHQRVLDQLLKVDWELCDFDGGSYVLIMPGASTDPAFQSQVIFLNVPHWATGYRAIDAYDVTTNIEDSAKEYLKHKRGYRYPQ